MGLMQGFGFAFGFSVDLCLGEIEYKGRWPLYLLLLLLLYLNIAPRYPSKTPNICLIKQKPWLKRPPTNIRYRRSASERFSEAAAGPWCDLFGAGHWENPQTLKPEPST